ncbi:interleukin-1 receptor-associated kinase 4 isoform X2 [Boleophthalmus pectinirostris]|uniref:interleukin-1 receptor-associated kinase 4 isoform X2 n=1 Tax=Boleophthalmus pectinirostris TaxID=150288 RepID=UPI00242B0E95|nr:interleukin-1 receptor-associated kinase 4 isoform X2 [Boleophthalmus pectinirostris]
MERCDRVHTQAEWRAQVLSTSRQFELLIQQGKSPTIELLNDWGTTNCTVRELVDILKSQQLLAAASLLLPEEVSLDPVLPVALDPDVTVVIGEERRVRGDDATVLKKHCEQESGEANHTGLCRFLFSDLRRITGNFDDRPVSEGGSRLGQGGFGTVYKGFLNNRAVAVKKLNPMENITMEELQVQFNQEILTLQTLKHENLIDMVGCSSDGPNPCLVYAFMSNGSLLDRLARLGGCPPLSWSQRCSIALGTAQGLEYLHANHHVHRDIKSANILLDEGLVAKISDFGLTRASSKHTSSTVMTGRVVGTTAYMAPEALRGQITPKSDIFSFGVVLLEILSGLPPADEDREPSLLMEMRYDIDDEDEELTLQMFLDTHMTDWDMGQAESIYSLASNCLYDQKNRRPLVTQVVAELKSVIKNISVESK